MKTRLLLSVTALICSASSFAQMWTGNNPVWHYNYWNVGEEGFIKIEQTGDSLIQGKTCQELTATKHMFFSTGPSGTIGHSVFPYGVNYVYESNDTVYYWQEESFRVLYDFSPMFGATWLVGITDPVESGSQCNDSSYTSVNLISTVNLGTETAALIELSALTGSELQLYGKANAHFGAMENYLFPSWRSCDPNQVSEYDMISFKCFQDDDLVYNPSGTDCEYLLTHLGVNEQQQLELSIYPNPVSEVLAVKVAAGTYHYRIVSVTGEVAAENTMTSSGGEAAINTDALKKGVYFLELSTSSAIQGRVRFVKQ